MYIRADWGRHGTLPYRKNPSCFTYAEENLRRSNWEGTIPPQSHLFFSEQGFVVYSFNSLNNKVNRLPWWRNLLIIHIRKKRGSHTITRPTLGGLRIAHRSWTSNAEAHACMYIAPLAYLIYNKVYLRLVNTHPWTSTIAMLFDSKWNLPDFYASRTKRQVNA